MRVYKKIIERVTIIGHYDKDHESAFDYINDGGYRVIRAGPKFQSKFKTDPSIFKIVAERETEQESK
jgi:hypothetical protein